jgi:hypothetical protein
MQVFHYSLRPTGFLLLGPSEGVGPAADFFDTVDKQRRIHVDESIDSGDSLALVASSWATKSPLHVMDPPPWLWRRSFSQCGHWWTSVFPVWMGTSWGGVCGQHIHMDTWSQ